MSGHLVWLAGRGVSMSCGLCWDVPPELEARYRRGEIGREALVARICDQLSRAEMDARIDTDPIRELFVRLASANRFRHSFVTTNWDGLLDRELRAHGFAPALHLNGSCAERNILLATDDERAREAVPQAREGLRRLMDADLAVAAGLSLASRLDEGLVARLRGKRGGRWLVVNHDAAEVRRTCELLRAQLPQCAVSALNEPFDAWVAHGLPGLAPDPSAAEQRAG